MEDVSSTIVANHFEDNTPVFTVEALKDIGRAPPTGGRENEITFWADTLFFSDYLEVPARNDFKTIAAYGETIPSMAETYLVYYPACVNKKPAEKPGATRSNPKKWRALKRTMSFCLQTLRSNTTDGRMNTKVIPEIHNLNWTNKLVASPKSEDLIQTCTQYKQEEYCFWGDYWLQYGRREAEIFTGTAVLIEYFDDS